ncbi:MAG: hypothetical protein ACRDNW_03160 [Trebonia sp.]
MPTPKHSTSARCSMGVISATAFQEDVAAWTIRIGQAGGGPLPRTRVWREVVGQCVAAGGYEMAVGCAGEITDNAMPARLRFPPDRSQACPHKLAQGNLH